MALAATMAQGVAPISVPHPIKTVYIDWRDINWNAPDQTVTSAVDGGFNVVVLAFFMGGAATDMLQVRVWACSVAGPRCVRQARGCHGLGVALAARPGLGTQPLSCTGLRRDIESVG